jgi:hypothetical protein
MFTGQSEDHLDELANHYSRGDNIEKAVEYLGRAGNQVMQRSAYNDAINRLSAAINLLQRLPDTPERAREELILQLAVGPLSITVRLGRAGNRPGLQTRTRALRATGQSSRGTFSHAIRALVGTTFARRPAQEL